RVFGLSQKCLPKVLEDLTSGKVAWGTGWLYSITGDERYKEAMLKGGNYNLSIQEPAGAWVRTNIIPFLELQPYVVGIEVTLERVAWLHIYAEALFRIMLC
ncbi:MAG: hypothetical protein JRJ37_10745, partial [Deltaproteobacteria bacterium]|nr:hypothetical protein [Deltaproteobacteria bacterium]